MDTKTMSKPTIVTNLQSYEKKNQKRGKTFIVKENEENSDK